MIERYDTSHKISFEPGSNESQLARQWIFFQASGQGPYYGQAVWFRRYHPESVPSALERYVKELKRVSGAVSEFLSKQDVGQGGPWLVGGRVSFADLAWVSWSLTVGMFIKKEDGYDVNEFPYLKNWLDGMMAREPVRKVIEEAEKL